MLGGVCCFTRRIMRLDSRYVDCLGFFRFRKGIDGHVIYLLTSVQKGMWAMIGTSIVLVIWTSGLLYLTRKAEKMRITEAEAEAGDEKQFEAGGTGDVKV